MADIPLFLLPRQATVEPYLGDSGTDDSYGPGVSVRCHLEDQATLLGSGERQGETKLFCRLEHGPSFPLESRVTWRGRAGDRVGYVQAVAEHDDGGRGAWCHLEVVIR